MPAIIYACFSSMESRCRMRAPNKAESILVQETIELSFTDRLFL